MHEVENIEKVLRDKMVLLQEQNCACESNHDPRRKIQWVCEDKHDQDDDLTIEIAEDINTMEDLVGFPPPVVFGLRLEQE